MGSRGVQVVWFKRDLRMADHRALAAAAERGPVVPLYVVEPELWQQPDMSARQWAFVRESLDALREELAAAGQPLMVRIGKVTEVLHALKEQFGELTLWSHEETGNGWTYRRDRTVAAWAAAAGVPWHEVRQSGVIRRLASRDGWAGRWDRFMAEPVTPPPPALEPIAGLDPGVVPLADEIGLAPDACPLRQRGGRASGLRCLQSFLFERGEPYRRAMSSPEAGARHCSRLSPHLAWGTLSMREVAQASWARQRDLKLEGTGGRWSGAMSSFHGRLHWRDHFMQKLEDEPSLERRELHPAYRGLRPKEPERARLEAWQKGETGLPFVDATMRALIATGWMNFRMRAMLTAFASYHLWLDWRAPGEHLARLFTDYEPGIHWSQVQMQSGTTGINTIRIYNPVKQGRDQDPEGRFIRRWIPELASVPDAFLHEPWRWDRAGEVLGRAYPEPIVDHLEAAREARDKVWAVRRGEGFRGRADAIQKKHGSRKAGIPMRGRPARKRQKAEGRQLDLFPAGSDS